MRFSFRRWGPRLALSLIGLAVMACSANADEAVPPSELAPEAEWRVQLIERASYFGFGRVGRAGQYTQEINAVRDLIQHPQGDAAFKRLVEAESLPTRLYGLSGLYFTDRAAFEKAVSELAKSDARVETMHGCIVMQEDVAKVVRLPAGEGIVLRPGETLAEWVHRNPTRKLKLDIAGGGIPWLIRDADSSK